MGESNVEETNLKLTVEQNKDDPNQIDIIIDPTPLMICVPARVLRELLVAFHGPSYMVNELLATRGLPGCPITGLTEIYIEWARRQKNV